jgi:hypothetical protein
MKLFLIALIGIPVTVFACPQLSGKYSGCISQNGSQSGTSSFIISQRLSSGSTIYSIGTFDTETNSEVTETVTANGSVVTRRETDSETGMVIESSFQATCKDNQLEIKSKALASGQIIADYSMVFQKDGPSLKVGYSGVVFEEPIDDLVTCK